MVELSPSCPACGKSPSLPAISPSPCAVGEAATAHTTPARQYKAHRAATSVHSVSLQCCALAPRGSGMAGGCECPGGLWLRCRLLSLPNTVLHSHTQLARVGRSWGRHLRDGRAARGRVIVRVTTIHIDINPTQDPTLMVHDWTICSTDLRGGKRLPD